MPTHFSLENDHSVYVLGAGFSCDRGLPTMLSFMNRMRDAHPVLMSQRRTREATAVETVLKYRLDAASAAYRIDVDVENIEHLFSLASIGQPKMFEDIRMAIAATLDVAQTRGSGQTLQLTADNTCPVPANWPRTVAVNPSIVEVKADRYEYYVACMLGLLGNPRSDRRTSIVSLNYDTLVEDALYGMQIPFHYGFAKQAVNFDTTCRCAKVGGNDVVPVLKLHGSLNWAPPKKPRGRGVTVYGSYQDVRTNGLVPKIIPPTWDKHLERRMAEVWSQARLALSTATRIVVIGFSMPETDLHFKYLLASGLQDNVSIREIVFVDPRKDAMEARVKELFRGAESLSPRVHVHGMRTTNLFHGWSSGQKDFPKLGRPFAASIHSINDCV